MKIFCVKGLIFLAIVFLGIKLAHSAEWKLIFKTNKSDLYIDQSSISNAGTEKTILIKNNEVQGERSPSSLELRYVINCSSNEVALVAAKQYKGLDLQGENSVLTVTSPPKWTEAKAGSAAGAYVKAACSQNQLSPPAPVVPQSPPPAPAQQAPKQAPPTSTPAPIAQSVTPSQPQATSQPKPLATGPVSAKCYKAIFEKYNYSYKDKYGNEEASKTIHLAEMPQAQRPPGSHQWGQNNTASLFTVLIQRFEKGYPKNGENMNTWCITNPSGQIVGLERTK